MAGSAKAADNPSKLVVGDCVFAEVYSFTPAECEIHLTNTGDAPIQMSGFKTLFAEDSSFPKQIVVEPHSSAVLHMRLGTDDIAGSMTRFVDFTTDESSHEQRQFTARGYVMSALDEAHPKLEFGNVDTSQPTQAREVVLGSHELVNFRIDRITEAPEYLDVKINDDRRGIQVRVKSDAPWGAREATVKLAIDTPRQKEAWVRVKANIHGDVVPPGNPLWFGFRPIASSQELLVPLVSGSGKEFVLGKLTLEGIDGKAEPADCEPVMKACRAVRVTWPAHQPLGMRKAVLRVELPSFKRELPIQLWGYLTNDAPGSTMVGTSPLTQATGKETPDAQTGVTTSSAKGVEGRITSQSTRPDSQEHLATPLGTRGDKQELPPPAGTGPLLKWSVANEKALYGFQVFRSDSESGPFVLLNVPAIPVDHQALGALYQWRDVSAVKGKIYWYYVGVVYNDGRKGKITEPLRSIVK